jgi:hypothetical protein
MQIAVGATALVVGQLVMAEQHDSQATQDKNHAPLADQLSGGMRQIEIDVFADPDGGRSAHPAIVRMLPQQDCLRIRTLRQKQLLHCGLRRDARSVIGKIGRRSVLMKRKRSAAVRPLMVPGESLRSRNRYAWSWDMLRAKPFGRTMEVLRKVFHHDVSPN